MNIDALLVSFNIVQGCGHDISDAGAPYIEYSENGKRIKTKLGRYLVKFYPGVPNELVQAITAKHKAESEGCALSYRVAETREEIKRVYENGPDSCMGKKSHRFLSHPVHPCEVYANPPHVAVAYLENNGRVTARAVISPKKKIYTRVYGDSALKIKLENEGYELGTLLNCELLYLENDNGDVIAPYVDGDVHDVYIKETDGEKFLRVSREHGEFEARRTDGMLNETDASACDICEDITHDDDLRYVDNTDQRVCEHCLDNHFTYAYVGRYQEYVSDTETTYQYAGENYTSDGLMYHGLWLDDDGEVYPDDQLVEDDDGYTRCIDDVIGYENRDGDTLYRHDRSDTDDIVTDYITGATITKTDASNAVSIKGDIEYTYDDDEITVDGITGENIFICEANEYADLLGDTRYTYADIDTDAVFNAA